MEWEHPDPYEHMGMAGAEGNEDGHAGDRHLASDPNCQRSSSWRDLLFNSNRGSDAHDGGDGGNSQTGVRSRHGKGGGRHNQSNRSVIVRAPSNWQEAISAVGEAMRFTYAETLSKWPMLDLVLGLRYMTRRHNHQGEAFADPQWKVPRERALPELAPLGRLLQLCAETSRKKFTTLSAFIEAVGLTMADVLDHNLKAGVLKPAYILLREESLNAVVLVIRGTQSVKDTLTAITGSVVPFHHTLVADSDGTSPGGEKVRAVVLGYAHCGMVVAARWFLDNLAPTLRAAMEANPGRRLLIVGHSLGGGTAAILTCMLRETTYFKDTTCVTFAPAACMTWELSESCNSFVTSVVHGCDIVPTFSAASLADLREEVRASSWSEELRADVDALRLMRLVKGSASAVKGKLALLTSAASLRLTKSAESIAVEGADASSGSLSNADGVEGVSAMTSSRSLLTLEAKPPAVGGALQSTANLGCMGVSWLLATSSRGSSSASAALSSLSGAMRQRLHTLITPTSSSPSLASSSMATATSSSQGELGTMSQHENTLMMNEHAGGWPDVPDDRKGPTTGLLAEERDALLACSEGGGASSGEEESERGEAGIGLGCAVAGSSRSSGSGRHGVAGDGIVGVDDVILEASEASGSGGWGMGGGGTGIGRDASEGGMVTVASVAEELCRMEEEAGEVGDAPGGVLSSLEMHHLVACMGSEQQQQRGTWRGDSTMPLHAAQSSSSSMPRATEEAGFSFPPHPASSGGAAGPLCMLLGEGTAAGEASSFLASSSERGGGAFPPIPRSNTAPLAGGELASATGARGISAAGASITRRRGARSGSPFTHRRASSASAPAPGFDGANSDSFFAGSGDRKSSPRSRARDDGYASSMMAGIRDDGVDGARPAQDGSGWGLGATAVPLVLASALPPMRMRREGSAPSLMALPGEQGGWGDGSSKAGGGEWGSGKSVGEKRGADTRPNGAAGPAAFAFKDSGAAAACVDDRSSRCGAAVLADGSNNAGGAGGSKRACVEDTPGPARGGDDLQHDTRTARLSEEWVDIRGITVPASAQPAGASRQGASAAASSSGDGGAGASSETDERERWYPPGRVLHFVRDPVPASKAREGEKEAAQGGKGTRFWDLGKEKAAQRAGAGAGGGDETGADSSHGGNNGTRRIELYMPDKRTYGKLRLGPTQVSDHYLPHYMGAFRDYFGQREELEVSTAPHVE
eukprot:jgi/Mesvir1/25471/Mv01735-RA.1